MATAAQDLSCINCIVKSKAEEYMKTHKTKTRADKYKSDDHNSSSPVCSPDFVQFLISAAVKQLIERQDNSNAELICERDEKINKLEKQVSQLKNENSELRQMIDDVSQYNRRDNLKIIGVPYKKDEDVVKIVKDITKHTTGEDLNESEISVAQNYVKGRQRKT